MYTYQIYQLGCPDTNRVAYVGMSRNANSRLLSHLGKDEKSTASFVTEKTRARVKQASKVIMWELTKDEAKRCEREIILELKKEGDCWLNTYYGTTPNTIKEKPTLLRRQELMKKTRKIQCQSGPEKDRLLSYNEARKKRIKDQNGVIYDSQRECERLTGCHRVSIKKVLSGEYKQTNGYTFEEVL